jgi:hypothetical protein
MNPRVPTVPTHIWRSSTKQLQEYKLNTVTYGVTCVVFLAFRVLQYISKNYCDSDSSVQEALQLQTYIDYVFMEADTPEDLHK